MTATADSQLFDSKQFKVPFPEVDGLEVNDLAIVFSGRLVLNRNDPEHAKLMESLTLGRKVSLSVFGNVASKQDVVKYDQDAAEHVTHQVTIRIDDVVDTP